MLGYARFMLGYARKYGKLCVSSYVRTKYRQEIVHLFIMLSSAQYRGGLCIIFQAHAAILLLLFSAHAE